MHFQRLLLVAALVFLCFTSVAAQSPAAAPKAKDEMRQSWQRNDDRYLRFWLLSGPIPVGIDTDAFRDQGGEARLAPKEGQEQKTTSGTPIRWRSLRTYSDDIGPDKAPGGADAIVYAFATVQRPNAGKALLSLGSSAAMRVWVNGALVHSHQGIRSLTPDEDQVEVTMQQGANSLLIKVPAGTFFNARVLEPGAVLARRFEIGPSLLALAAEGFTVKTDIGAARPDADPVQIQIARPGGIVVFDTTAVRGALAPVNAHGWSDGPYEIRCITRTPTGLKYIAYLSWYKGEFLPKARELAAAAAAADITKPEGATLAMLAAMVEDRLGGPLTGVKGNPWEKVVPALTEYDEMMLDRKGLPGRIHPHGFVRMAYRDEVDGSVQWCRVYLPADYDPAKKWPVVVVLHGYNGENPPYYRWWGVDERHPRFETEFPGHEQVIYLEAHGRGNTQYRGMGDADIVRVIAEAKTMFSIDEDRVYLTGDSMGGWGTWNVSTRHPDFFAAIAPVFGGSDYHAQMPEEALVRLTPDERFTQEKQSSWSMADGLLNVPIYVRHGDADQAVNVEFSRWGVRMLQRWGYNIRYQEYPGKVHEALEFRNGNLNTGWLLQYRRDPNPRHVRLRSAELRHASVNWVNVLQAATPLAFMQVDAEVVDHNVIRLDTRNVLDVTLTPGPALVNPQKPVSVVWNGVAHTLTFHDGTLRLTDAAYAPAAVHKNGRLPGAIEDFTTTPFAIVVGTVSKDTAMVDLCRRKAEAFITAWKEWQKVTPRVFADTALDERSMVQYSLLLIGGPEANSVTARLAGKIPVWITPDKIIIDTKSFPARDAALQMLYPNPLNPERYVWLVAGTSLPGMFFAQVQPQRMSEWDYLITDGKLPAAGQRASDQQIGVACGMFDYNWRYRDSLSRPGDPTLRASARQRHLPKANALLSPALLDAITGRYQITHGPLLEVLREGGQLRVRNAGETGSGTPVLFESGMDFFVPEANAWISFQQDAKGVVTGLLGFQNGEFEGKRMP